jgi:hypothetical protein
MQIFVKDRNGFLVVRSFLGLAEAGYIPGAAFTLSTWVSEFLPLRLYLALFRCFESLDNVPDLPSADRIELTWRSIPGEN